MEDLHFAFVALDARGGARGVFAVGVDGDAKGGAGDRVGVASFFFRAGECEQDRGHFICAAAV